MGFKVGEEFDFASPFDPTDVQKVNLEGIHFLLVIQFRIKMKQLLINIDILVLIRRQWELYDWIIQREVRCHPQNDFYEQLLDHGKKLEFFKSQIRFLALVRFCKELR